MRAGVRYTRALWGDEGHLRLSALSPAPVFLGVKVGIDLRAAQKPERRLQGVVASRLAGNVRLRGLFFHSVAAEMPGQARDADLELLRLQIIWHALDHSDIRSDPPA